jgi:flagellar motor switch protein FliN/FliY
MNENINNTKYQSYLDTKFNFDVLLGTSTITVKEFLGLESSNIILLDKMVGDGSDIYINSRVIGNGEILVFDEHITVKIRDVSTADEALGYFYTEGST